MPLHVDTSSGVARAVDAPVGGAPAHPWERVSADSEAEAAPAAPQPKADTPSTRTNTQVSVSDVVSGDTAVHVPVGTRVVLCGLRKYSQFNGEVAEVTGVKGKYALVQAMGEVLQLKRIHYREPTEAELRAATFSPTPTPSVSQVSQKGNSKPAAHPSTVASGSDVRGGGGGGGEVESRGEREGVAEAGGEEGEGLARQDSASQNLPQVALTENVSVRMQPGGDKLGLYVNGNFDQFVSYAFFDPETRTLAPDTLTPVGHSDRITLPEEGMSLKLEKLIDLCKGAGVQHNIRVIRAVEIGDVSIRLEPNGKLGVHYNGTFSQYVAQAFYDPVRMVICPDTFTDPTDPEALKLPAKNLGQTLADIVALCEMTGTRHNIVLPPLPAEPAPVQRGSARVVPASTTNSSSSSSSSSSSDSSSSPTRTTTTHKDDKTNGVTENERRLEEELQRCRSELLAAQRRLASQSQAQPSPQAPPATPPQFLPPTPIHQHHDAPSGGLSVTLRLAQHPEGEAETHHIVLRDVTLAGLLSHLPNSTIHHATHLLLTTTIEPALSGVYTVSNELEGGHPLWICADGRPSCIYLNEAGKWTVTSKRAHAAQGTGWLKARRALGREAPPYEVRSWLSNDGHAWTEEHDATTIPLPKLLVQSPNQEWVRLVDPSQLHEHCIIWVGSETSQPPLDRRRPGPAPFATPSPAGQRAYTPRFPRSVTQSHTTLPHDIGREGLGPGGGGGGVHRHDKNPSTSPGLAPYRSPPPPAGPQTRLSPERDRGHYGRSPSRQHTAVSSVYGGGGGEGGAQRGPSPGSVLYDDEAVSLYSPTAGVATPGVHRGMEGGQEKGHHRCISPQRPGGSVWRTTVREETT